LLQTKQLKELVHSSDVTKGEQLLLLLALDAATPKSIQTIKDAAANAGLRWVKTANVSDRLARTRGLAIRTSEGWELSARGREALSARFPQIKGRASKPAQDLRGHLATISSTQTRAFLEEAVACCEAQLWRAAVVFSWCGAVAVLHEHVVKNELQVFNTEAKRRDAKWKDAKTADDLGRMKEHDLLDVLGALSILGPNVKRELQDNCLSLRNACGHPSSLKLSEARVAAHVEMLILNVFAKF
jgi:hypothetical protein